jgi:hypothetical protein
MKLGNLRGAIRKTKGNPTFTTTFGGVEMTLTLQKGPLLEALGEAFPDGAETGIEFDSENAILFEAASGAAVPAPSKEPAPASSAPAASLLLDDEPKETAGASSDLLV